MGGMLLSALRIPARALAQVEFATLLQMSISGNIEIGLTVPLREVVALSNDRHVITCAIGMCAKRK